MSSTREKDTAAALAHFGTHLAQELVAGWLAGCAHRDKQFMEFLLDRQRAWAASGAYSGAIREVIERFLKSEHVQ